MKKLLLLKGSSRRRLGLLLVFCAVTLMFGLILHETNRPISAFWREFASYLDISVAFVLMGAAFLLSVSPVERTDLTQALKEAIRQEKTPMPARAPTANRKVPFGELALWQQLAMAGLWTASGFTILYGIYLGFRLADWESLVLAVLVGAPGICVWPWLMSKQVDSREEKFSESLKEIEREINAFFKGKI